MAARQFFAVPSFTGGGGGGGSSSSSASPTASKVEAERLIGIAEKQLHARDLSSCREFALLAQETEPLLDGPDQILAVSDVLLAAEKRVNNNRHNDWYAILQVDRRCGDLDLIKKQYRRLALLLHPDKNRFAFADSAFKLVADAWAVLSDSAKKARFDQELGLFSRVDLVSPPPHRQQPRPPPPRKHPSTVVSPPATRNSGSSSASKKPINVDEDIRVEVEEEQAPDQNSNSSRPPAAANFWTACPYCYQLFEYPRAFEGCCLRCQNCRRAFHGASIPSLPPLVPGKEAYYCCWAVFPLGFAPADTNGKSSVAAAAPAPEGFPNWVPPIFPSSQPF